MDIIKFLTAGSVDDGKSTLIGRLLFETSSLKEDQIAAAERINQNGELEIDLASITDGLIAEQEQGITIDVSYKYFSTINRRFIIADCPGHTQYTRNMITGASNSDLIILLINAKNGISAQTELHYKIAELLKMDHVIVCINKMDLVDFKLDTFEGIKREFMNRFKPENTQFYFVPTCATLGDNIVTPSINMDWYLGPTILELLNEINIEPEVNAPFRFPVQSIIKKTEPDQLVRYHLGSVFSGSLKKGDEIKVFPIGQVCRVKEIVQYKTSLDHLLEGEYAGIVLEDDIDISRGDIFVNKNDSRSQLVSSFEAELCWMDETELNPMIKYKLKYSTSEAFCKFSTIQVKEGNDEIHLNTLFKAEIQISRPLAIDMYRSVKKMGGFIIINPVTNKTVAAGVVVG